MPPTRTAGNARRARLRPFLLTAGFLVLLAIQTVPPRWAALATATWLDARALSEALHDDESRLPGAARALTRDARAWRAESAPVLFYAPQFDWLPYLGGDFKTARQWTNAFDAVLEAVEPSLEAYEKLLPYLKTGPAGKALAGFSKNNGAEIVEAQAAVQNARARFDAIPARDLSPQARALLDGTRRGLDEWSGALTLLERAPLLLGAESPKKYLVLAQNNDELRPTGGFITAVGVVQVNRGEIQMNWFGDSLSADDLNLIHPSPPLPLQKYMWASQWLLRDANWYAHFPTSADVAQSMYARDHGVRTDGVIAVDMRFLPLLVQAVPGLELGGVTLTRDNVIGEIKANWKPLPPSDYMTSEWFSAERKNFLGDLLRAVIAHMEDGSVRPATLAQAILFGLNGKVVQLYFNDAAAQQAVVSAGWGGAIQPGGADYLSVIDSNVGFNKVNARVTREIFYTVRLRESGGDATAEILYHNPSRPESDGCDLLRQHKDATYLSMEHSCYWNYVRVLTPRFTQLISARGVSDAGYADDIDAVTAFGGYLLVNRNSDARVQFHYSLPNTILQDSVYALQLQTQAGTAAEPIRVRVEYPASWKIHNTTDDFNRVDDHTIEIQKLLARDEEIRIYFDK